MEVGWLYPGMETWWGLCGCTQISSQVGVSDLLYVSAVNLTQDSLLLN